MIKPGSKWHSNYVEFVVERVEGDWIHYAKSDKFGKPTEQKYNCLIGAFMHRFSEITQ